MILADTTYSGQLNLPDMFTRLMLSLVATGIAPGSFYELDADGNRQRAHYDGLPVEFIAEAISTLGVQVTEGFETYHVMNPYDDGLGHRRVRGLADRSGLPGAPHRRLWPVVAALRHRAAHLPDKQRQASLPAAAAQLPAADRIRCWARPRRPTGSGRLCRKPRSGPTRTSPIVSPAVIVKYITNLQMLGLL